MNISLRTHNTLAAIALGFAIASAGGCTTCGPDEVPTATDGTSIEKVNTLSPEVAAAVATATVQGIEEHVIPKVVKLNAEKLRGQARMDLAAIGGTVGTYAMTHGGDYPTNLSQLDPTPASDPYGNPYVLKPSSDLGFELWCLGADGKLGGQGFDADYSYQMVINGQR